MSQTFLNNYDIFIEDKPRRYKSMSEITITKNNFKNEVTDSGKPVLIDFWASWCGPCRMLSPTVKEIADEHPEYTVGKVNVDEEFELAQQFGIMSIPTLIAFKDGRAVKKTVGVQPKAAILNMLK